MLEGDEVLDVAQETGYRLCRMTTEDVQTKQQQYDDNNSKQLVFSVTWDQNNNRRMYICMQDGQLRTVDLDVPSNFDKDYSQVVSSPNKIANADLDDDIDDQQQAPCLTQDFQVRFRRFLSSKDAFTEPDRLIQYHWDKMVTIPGRPDEFLFLLGISRSIMYTSLPASLDHPYPVKPLLSSLTRSDFSGFIYGTPVLQICSHSSRITALATSSQGQLLASGDEEGHLRILMLQLLADITGKPNNNSPMNGQASTAGSMMSSPHHTNQNFHRTYSADTFGTGTAYKILTFFSWSN